MLELRVTRFFQFLIFLISAILFPIYSYAADNAKPGSNQKIVFEVVTRNINEDDENKFPEIHFFVIKKGAGGKVDQKFHEVECIASDYMGSKAGRCSAVTLPDGKFLLADCFSHNTECYSCMLIRFNSDGTQDSTFKTPFTSSRSEIVNGSPEHEIKDIEQVTVERNQIIRIRGVFISPLIGWTNKQAQGDIGDTSGKEGVLLLKQDGQFDSFTPKKHADSPC